MKKITFLMMFILLCLNLVGCGFSKFNKCKNHLKTHMKDPSSMTISSAIGYESGSDSGCAFKIVYNGKNSYGAYAGNKTSYVYLSDDGYISCSECSGDFISGSMYSVFSSNGKKIYEK